MSNKVGGGTIFHIPQSTVLVNNLYNMCDGDKWMVLKHVIVFQNIKYDKKTVL